MSIASRLLRFEVLDFYKIDAGLQQLAQSRLHA